MRIGIDVRWLQQSLINKSLGGIGGYSYHLVKGLLSLDSNNEYIFFISKDKNHKEFLQLINGNLNARIHDLPENWEVTFAPECLKIVPVMAQERLCIVPRLKESKLDVFHSLHQFTPSYRIQNCRSLVTVHDLIHGLFPEIYLRRKIQQWVYFTRISAIKKASKIIANSENTKKDVIRLLDVPENKIRVVYLGVGEDFRPAESSPLVKSVMQKYGINKKYILHVGGVSATKNVNRLLLAFKRLLTVHKKDLALVVVGNFSFTPDYQKAFGAKLEELDLQKRVILPGHVPEKDLILLYNGASLFVYPSLYEGFGLPPLEAMACGCPVVVSNAASIPEVVGNIGLYVNPHKVNEIVSAMEKVLTNKSLREKMVGRGLERAKLFSWEKMAKETLAIYENV